MYNYIYSLKAILLKSRDCSLVGRKF